MKIKCNNCGHIEDFEHSIGVRSECSKCKNDLHCCKNCCFYNESSYNECRESQADRVLDKQKSNYCDFFKPATFDDSNISPSKLKQDTYKALDALFSK